MPVEFDCPGRSSGSHVLRSFQLCSRAASARAFGTAAKPSLASLCGLPASAVLPVCTARFLPCTAGMVILADAANALRVCRPALAAAGSIGELLLLVYPALLLELLLPLAAAGLLRRFNTEFEFELAFLPDVPVSPAVTEAVAVLSAAKGVMGVAEEWVSIPVPGKPMGWSRTSHGRSAAGNKEARPPAQVGSRVGCGEGARKGVRGGCGSWRAADGR